MKEIMEPKAKTEHELPGQGSDQRQEIENLKSAVEALKRDKEILEKKEAFLTSIFASIPEGYAALDPEMNILFANLDQERRFAHGLPLVGKKCYAAFHDRNQVCFDCPCQQTLKTGQPANRIFPFPTGEGEIPVWFLQYSFPLLDPQTSRISGVVELVRNITEQKQMADVLKRSEERYRLIVEQSNDGIVWIEGSKIIFFNQSARRIFGYDPEEEIEGNSFLTTIHPDDRERVLEINRRRRGGEEVPFKYEFKGLRKNGEPVDVEVSVTETVYQGKNLFLNFLRDVTNRKQAEASLRESEEKYRTILETIEDGYYEVDLKGNMTFFNDAMALINGYSRTEMQNMNYRKYMDAENSKKIYQEFNRVYRTGIPSKVLQYEVITKNGEKRTLETSISLVRDPSGDPVSFRGISRDITQLRQAQRALEASEEKYRTILETIEDGYYEIDLTGAPVMMNEAMARMSGYSKSELLAVNFRNYTDAETSRKLKEAYIRAYQTGESCKGIEHEVRCKDGTKKILEASLSLVRDPSGKPIGFRGITRDITELRQTRADLIKSEEKYRTIIETMEEGFYEVDLKGKLTFVNEAMARMSGYSKSELLALNIRDYIDVETDQRLKQVYIRVFQTGEPCKCIEHEVICQDGTKKTIEASISLVRDPSGKPIGFRGITRDITEIRQTEKALEKSEERFRVAAECTNDFIYEQNLKTGQLEWFGKAIETFKDLLGDLPADNMDFEKMIHPEDRGRIVKAMKVHIWNQEPFRQEYRMIRKDGNIIHLFDQGLCLWSEKGKPHKWIGTLTDITERKKKEEELKQSLEKLHKTMGGIIQAMALTVESKDPYTAGHQQRVSQLGRAIAQEMGLSKDQIEAVRMAGTVHDLGKISIPGEILSKPTQLSDIEFKLLKVHPETSYDILKDIDFPWPIARIALQHHERIDGSGYPSGLKGDEILIEAKVLMVADVVEAIASHRPYRPARGIEVALEEISQNRDNLYDAEVVDACLRLFKEKGFKLE